MESRTCHCEPFPPVEVKRQTSQAGIAYYLKQAIETNTAFLGGVTLGHHQRNTPNDCRLSEPVCGLNVIQRTP